jgi:hypothetical protein
MFEFDIRGSTTARGRRKATIATATSNSAQRYKTDKNTKHQTFSELY